MATLLQQLQNFLILMKSNLSLAFIFVGIFWLIFLINLILGKRLTLLGIYPRHGYGIPGIIFSPFLHADFSHLLLNSVPLLILSDFILIIGFQLFIVITIGIILASGILIWLFARPGIHIGASGLVMGYFGYLLANAYQHPSISTIILALVCLYYFGSLLLGLFPQQERISWEGHLFGFVTGVVLAFLL